jgi:hypothetical protein
MFGDGGIVNRPTLAWVGERGEREAIVPERFWPMLGGGGGGGHGHTIVMDGRVVGELVDERMGQRRRMSSVGSQS